MWSPSPAPMQFHGTAFEFFRNTVSMPMTFSGRSALPSTASPITGGRCWTRTSMAECLAARSRRTSFSSSRPIRRRGRKTGLRQRAIRPRFCLRFHGRPSNTAAFQAALGRQFVPRTIRASKNDQTFEGGVQVACNGSNINPVAINLLQLKNPDGSYPFPARAMEHTKTPPSVFPPSIRSIRRSATSIM